MKLKLIFICLIFLLSLFHGGATAATGDVIDNFQFSSTACVDMANVVFADVDGIYNGETYGNYETMAVFWTITGEAYPTNEDPLPGKWYFFSPQDTNCGGTAPWDRARVLVRFVDMLAPGFVANSPGTWVWKGIETVSIRSQHDLCVAPDIPAENASMTVQAFGDVSQSIPVSGTITDEGDWKRHDFSDQSGIMELDVSSDFCNNFLDDLILDNVYVPTGMPGDCNGDELVDAGDLSALVGEIFDGDGNLRGDAPLGTFAGTVDCDANEDDIIDAGDLSCTVSIIFNGPDACSG